MTLSRNNKRAESRIERPTFSSLLRSHFYKACFLSDSFLLQQGPVCLQLCLRDLHVDLRRRAFEGILSDGRRCQLAGLYDQGRELRALVEGIGADFADFFMCQYS